MKRRDTIVRYTAPERINHWITAFCFVLAAVSGLGFLFPSFNWLIQIMGTPQLARILCLFAGVVMFALFIIMSFRHQYHNLINRDDIFQAKNICKIVVNEKVGDTGRHNFGQKCVFWAATIFPVLLLMSNVIIQCPYFAPAFSILVTRFALMLHLFVTVALIVVTMVHIYAVFWVKGTITVMVEGWVTNAWMKKHHPCWCREIHKTTEKKAE